MYSAYKLNKQGDNVQPWCTPFLIWNQSVVPCLLLTVASWPAYRFLRRQVRWSGIPISLRIFHSLLWSTQSEASLKAIKQKQMFFWMFFFFNHPADVDHLISASSAFSKSSLNVWKFTVHVNLFLHFFSKGFPSSFCFIHSFHLTVKMSTKSYRFITLNFPFCRHQDISILNIL